MKKIVYKSIFSIVIMLFAFLMLPNKQVKAQEEQTFPEVIMKIPYYTASWDNEYTSTYEFTIKYRLNTLIYTIPVSLNENDYFLTTTMNRPIQKGIPNTSVITPSYELEEIQIENNYTIFVVRFQIGKTFVANWYGGPEYIFPFFENDSAFYIKYDVYQYGYDLGYMVGYGDGYNFGLDQGYDNGFEDGHERGYLRGWGEGWYTGYVDGRTETYLEGYEDGYEDGEQYGYHMGYEYGYNVGYNNGENAGYQDGFRAGEKSKIAQNNEAFYNSIEKWLVPSIITVIVLGGIVSIISIKRREE